MIDKIRSLILWSKSSEGKKAIRYSLTSVISAVVSQVAFFLLYGVLAVSSKTSSIAATLLGAIPSYILNRYWAFGKKAKNSFWREIFPYFVMAVIGLVFSTWSSDFADSHKTIVGTSHLAQVILVDGAYFGSFAILWVAKYIFLKRILFSIAETPAAVAGGEPNK
ncbi:MAG: GtrA family protein [Actinomycetota bacterium]|nr:GtrA family protein [Actinomycetota bacterium]